MTRDLHHDPRSPRHATALPSERSFGVTFACVFVLVCGNAFLRKEDQNPAQKQDYSGAFELG